MFAWINLEPTDFSLNYEVQPDFKTDVISPYVTQAYFCSHSINTNVIHIQLRLVSDNLMPYYNNSKRETIYVRDIEARSQNHCYREKALSSPVTYS